MNNKNRFYLFKMGKLQFPVIYKLNNLNKFKIINYENVS